MIKNTQLINMFLRKRVTIQRLIVTQQGLVLTQQIYCRFYSNDKD